MDAAEITLFLSETLGGRYRPYRYLASGGFAGTFEATDHHTSEAVAAKILQLRHCADPDAVTEFRDEVAMLQKLTGCDRVVRLHDSGSQTVQLQHSLSGGTIPITTEFAILELAAGSLADLLMLGTTIEWTDRLRLFRDVVKGIHQMHLNRCVHRDVKSENVLVFNDPPVAKVTDLGRARDTSSAPRYPINDYLMGRGDVRFAPPEFLWLQGSDEPDPHAFADLYLLGSLLFEIAVGVGITSIITNDPFAVINSNAALPAVRRESEWRAAVPLLRDGAQPAYESFESVMPGAIRGRAGQLLRILTDPDPGRRLAHARRGVAASAWDLRWLLEFVDSIRRGIDPTLRKAYLESHHTRSVHARPRGR